jgi:hypothetical protein
MISCKFLSAQSFVGTNPPNYLSNEFYLKLYNFSQDSICTVIGNNSDSTIVQLINLLGVDRIVRPFISKTELALNTIYRVRITDPLILENAIISFKNYKEVEWIEKIQLGQSAICTNVNDYINSTLPNTSWELDKILACDAWIWEDGALTTEIAVIDNSFQPNHLDFDGKITGTWDVADNDINVMPPPLSSNNFWNCSDASLSNGDKHAHHGTLSAGSIAASTNNNIGIASIGRDCSIILIKGAPDELPINTSGGCATATPLTYGYEGMVKAVDFGASVINCSYLENYPTSMGQSIVDWVVNVKQRVIVASMGNYPLHSKYYPAAYNEVIAVGATDQLDVLSVWGGGQASNYGSWMDVLAPGTDIWTTSTDMLAGVLQTNEYYVASGTSTSAPIVSGLCGLIKSLNPNFTVAQVKECLYAGSDNVDAQNPTFVGNIGHGRINALKALQCNNGGINITASSYNICPGSTTTFTLNPNGHATTNVNWSFPGGVCLNCTTANNLNPIVSYAESGTYNVSAYLIDGANTYSKLMTNQIKVIGIQEPDTYDDILHKYRTDDIAGTSYPYIGICEGSVAKTELRMIGESAFTLNYNYNGNNLSCSGDETIPVYVDIPITNNLAINHQSFFITSITSNGTTCPLSKEIKVKTTRCCTELITNGKFSSGNTSFSSELDYIPPTGNAINCPSKYTIEDVTGTAGIYPLCNTNFGNSMHIDAWAASNFCTSTNIVAVNGFNNAIEKQIWQQTVASMETETVYQLSFFISANPNNTINYFPLRIKAEFENSNGDKRSCIYTIPNTNFNLLNQATMHFDVPINFTGPIKVTLKQLDYFDEVNYNYFVDNISLKQLISEGLGITAAIGSTTLINYHCIPACLSTITLNAQILGNSNSNYTIEWVLPDGQTYLGATLTPFNFLNGGGYCQSGKYRVNLLNANGCNIFRDEYIYFNSNINVSLSPNACYPVGATVNENLVITATTFNNALLPLAPGNSLTYDITGPNAYSCNTSNCLLTNTGLHYINVDNGYCQVTSTVTVKQAPSLNITADFTCLPNSNGNQAILTALATNGISPYDYKLNNQPYQTAGTFTINTSGIYTITVLGANGCETSSTITINSGIFVSATANTTSACIGQPIILNGGGATTYTWSNGIINNIPFSFAATNTYTVTGTNAINGCTNTSTITINEIPFDLCACIPVTETPDFILTPPINCSTAFGGVSILNNKLILIKGVFDICNNLTFNNCHIIMVPDMAGGVNQTAINTNGFNLELNDTEIESCGNEMWKGITVPNTIATVYIHNNSKLSDMIYGVHFTGTPFTSTNPIAKIENSTFSNNYYALRFYHMDENSAGYIRGNTFNTTGVGFKNPYLAGKTFHAIDLFETLSGFEIGQSTATANIFNNVQTGIYSSLDASATWTAASSIYGFNATNNTFTNIIGGPQINDYNLNANHLYGKEQGCAIYADNPNLHVKNPTTITISEINVANNNFTDCSKGIVTNATHSIIDNNTMLNVQCGSMNNFTEWCKYSVTANTITNTHMGMQFVGNSGNNSQVVGNHIILNNNYLVMPVPVYYNDPNNGPPTFAYFEDRAIWPIGIDVKHSNNTYNSPFEIGSISSASIADINGELFSNIIDAPARGGVGIQMNLTGCGYNVEANLVRYTNADALNCGGLNNPINGVIGSCGNFMGVSISNAVNSMFVKNKVRSDNTFAQPVFHNRSSTGFFIDNSTKLLLQCNSVARLGFGFDVRGNCYTAEDAVRGNRFSDHKLAMVFRSYNSNPGGFQDIIGSASATNPYQDNGNLFNESYYAYSCPTCTTKVLRLTYSGDVNPLRKIYINPTNPNANNPGNIVQSESRTNYPLNNSQYFIDPDDNYIVYDECVAPSSEKMEDEDNSIEEGLATEIASNNGLTYPLFDEVRDYMDKSTLYRTLDVDTALRNSNSTLSTFYTTKQTDNIGNIRESDVKITELLTDTLAQTDSLVYANRLSLAKTAKNNIVIGTKAFENCERFINSIYLTIIENGINTVDSASLVGLSALAHECPAATGTCVYKARSILASIIPGLQYYDDDACAAALPSFKNGENLYLNEQTDLESLSPPVDSTASNVAVKVIKVYPNPVDRQANITLVYNLTCEAALACYITDVVGRRVQTINLECGNKRVQTNLDDLSTGIYNIVLLQNGKKIFNQKLDVR